MNTTIIERKQKAIEYMKKLDIYKPYIKGFKENDEVCFFEGFAGVWAWQDEELQSKIKKLEEKYNCTVYAVTHEYSDFGELYDFLIVTDYKEEWDDLVLKCNNTYYSFAYVWNKSDEDMSEFGTVAIQSFGGGIKRIG